MNLFYDTNVLLNLQEKAFDNFFYISNISLVELEEIKNSKTKDEEVKWKARNILRLLKEYAGGVTIRYEVIPYNDIKDKFIKKKKLAINNDSRIIATAYRLSKKVEDLLFITQDLSCAFNAGSVGLKTSSHYGEEKEDYTGYKEKIFLDEKDLAKFYNDILINNINEYNLVENQYLLIIQYNKDSVNKFEIIDKYKWKNNMYVKIPFYKIETKMFGKISALDDYQQLAMDSLFTNKLTLIRGVPGSGKSLLGLAALFNRLEKGEISKIIIFCNPVVTRGAAKLGFYPGDKNDKLLDSQIGNFLIGKLGSITVVEQMITDGTLVLVPVGDCRGMDTTGMNAGIYVTEGQNMDIDMLKLVLQRIGEDCYTVIEGDDRAQTDLIMYAGNNNGIRRMSEVFKGVDFYGEVTLKSCHRSRIAELAEKM